MRNKTILVCDDNELFREMIIEMLEDHHFTVVGAEGCAQAKEMLVTDKIDLLITDIVIPDNNEGQSLMNTREQFPELPVIALSGDPFKLQKIESDLGENRGIFTAFSKPVDIRELLTVAPYG